MREAVAVLSGAIIKDKSGHYRMGTFEEGDDYGASGDYIRAVAAGYLYQQNNGLIFVASGNGHGEHGQLKDKPEVPLLSKVIKKELIDQGIPMQNILEEKNSDNTYQQLQEVKKLFSEKDFQKITILSNLYHLPRIEAMIETDQKLKSLYAKDKIVLIAAEDVLMESDPDQWQEIIEQGYETPGIQKRIELEGQGVKQIREGNYNFR